MSPTPRSSVVILLATCTLLGCQNKGADIGLDASIPTDGGLSRGSLCAKPRTEPFGPVGGRIVIGADESPALAGLSLFVPGGALNGAVELMVTCGDELAGPNDVPLSASVRLLPESEAFLIPVTLTLPLLGDAQPPGSELAVAVRAGGQTTYVTGGELHPGPGANNLSIDITHFGDFEVVARKPIIPPSTKNIDVLFVMDNSPSMSPKQRTLTTQIPRFIRQLDSLGLDYHIGIVSTDVGSNIAPMMPWGGNIGKCDTFAGDDGVLQSAACTSRTDVTSDARNACTTLCPDDHFVPNDGKSYISKISGVSNVPVKMMLDPMTGTMIDVGPISAFQCMALLGDTGCGLESPLEAAKRALDGHRAENSGFLRPDSLLAVIFLTDEDDCSVQLSRRSENNPATMDCATADQNAAFGCYNVDYRCLARSVVCDQPMNTSGVKTHCTERPNNYLEPTGNYAKFFRGLRPDSRLFIGGIWTQPTITKGGKLAVSYSSGGSSSPFLNRDRGADAACVYSGDATIVGQAQLRLSAFAANFADAQQYSICDLDNFARSVSEIAKAIGEKVKK